MRNSALALSIIIASVASPAVAAEPSATFSIGVKTENLRPGGGVVVSKDPVIATNAQINGPSGLYGRLFSTIGRNKRDTELDATGGAGQPCLGDLRCQIEVGYWYRPVQGDLVNVAAQISGSHTFGKGESVNVSARVEELVIFNQADTQIFRLKGVYTKTIKDVPIQLSAEVAHNRAKSWWHVPLGISARLTPKWLPKGMSITPSVEALLPLNRVRVRNNGIEELAPLNHVKVRHTGLAFGLTIGIAR